MAVNAPALIVAAAGVGFGHAILPDHWVPLAVMARTRGLSVRRVARLSALAGAAHVLVSVILGAVIVLVGLQLRSTVEHAQDAIVGGLLILTGVAFAGLELTGRGHSHPHGHTHDHSHPHDNRHPQDHGHTHDGHTHTHGRAHNPGRLARITQVAVPFGAAASPDLTILPVFLAAAAAGPGAAIGSLVAFAIATAGTIVTLTVVATKGGYQVGGAWLDRWGNALTAGVLIVIGGLILGGVI